MITIPNCKRGQTFLFEVDAIDDFGNPVTNGVSTLKAQIRDKFGNLVNELTIEQGSVSGKYILRTDDTDDWVVGSLLYFDIRHYDGNETRYSDTLVFEVEEGITRVE